ncbi:Cytochrome P450 monooxygenase cypX [Colletotrichum fructicola Nara gc5]|uniref:Cytochrome P450 monooxygenase cypX n=1 Tax=Colletotrichum fructicola (strain Nara gc5) TaxID=1213859 RepID=A0A7J6ILC3_COLFN|nr:Cytochrome P450 monooxygenase cypX [Colletotrichum fructicola Nara gc5]
MGLVSRPIAVLLAGIVIISTLRIALRSLLSPLKYIPGPWYSHFTHYVLKYHVVMGRRIFYVDDLHRKYGDIVRLSPGEVSVVSVDSHRKIYSVSSRCTKHEWYLKFGGHSYPGLFTMTDHQEHAQRRKMFARAFSKSQLRVQWEDTIRAIAKKDVHRIADDLKENGKADVLKCWTFMTSDISGELMFGESWDMLGKGQKNEFIRSVAIYIQSSGLTAELPLIKTVGRLIPHPWCRTAFRGWDYVLDYASRAVENSKKRTQMGERNIFGTILAGAEKGEILTEFDIKNEAGNFTVAATDTTAVTLSYLIYAVLSRPKLQAEIEAEVSTLPDNFTDADVETLPLLNATISETNRLFAAAQGAFPRRAPSGGLNLEGYMIPEKTTVSAQSYTMHRKEDLFPNALEFNPERWFAESNMSSDAKAVVSPFGSGSRICIGIHVAYMETRLAAAGFFRECRGVELAEETTPESMGFMNYFATFPKSDQSPPCRLCVLHGRECTFIEAAAPRKRTVPADGPHAGQVDASVDASTRRQTVAPSPGQVLGGFSVGQLPEDGPMHFGEVFNFDTTQSEFEAMFRSPRPPDSPSAAALETEALNMSIASAPNSGYPAGANPQLMGLSSDMDPLLIRHYRFDEMGMFAFKELAIHSVQHSPLPCQFLISQQSLFSRRREEEAGLSKGYEDSFREELQQVIPLDVGRRLVRLFYQFIHPKWPIFSESHPLDPESAPLCLVAATYAISLPFAVHDDKLSVDVAYDKPPYAELSRIIEKSLAYEMHSPTLAIVQALLLLVLRPSSDPMVADTASRWDLLGRLTSCATTLGLHLDPSRWSMASWQISHRQSSDKLLSYHKNACINVIEALLPTNYRDLIWGSRGDH